MQGYLITDILESCNTLLDSPWPKKQEKIEQIICYMFSHSFYLGLLIYFAKFSDRPTKIASINFIRIKNNLFFKSSSVQPFFDLPLI